MTCRLFPELQSAYRCNVFCQHFKDKFGFCGTALEFQHVVIDSAASVKFDISFGLPRVLASNSIELTLR